MEGIFILIGVVVTIAGVIVGGSLLWIKIQSAFTKEDSDSECKRADLHSRIEVHLDSKNPNRSVPVDTRSEWEIQRQKEKEAAYNAELVAKAIKNGGTLYSDDIIDAKLHHLL